MDKLTSNLPKVAPEVPQAPGAKENAEGSWYSGYYDSTMRYVEDTYLKYFGENRASYGAKGMSSPFHLP